MYWIYVLENSQNKRRYIGYTKDLRKRLKEHKEREVFSTKFWRNFKILYVEGCLDQEDAARREKYLKTTGGRRFLAKRLRQYYAS